MLCTLISTELKCIPESSHILQTFRSGSLSKMIVHVQNDERN